MFTIILPDKREVSVKYPEEIYYAVSEYLCNDIFNISESDHMIAANAQGWAELACYGDTYETSALKGLFIEFVED